LGRRASDAGEIDAMARHEHTIGAADAMPSRCARWSTQIPVFLVEEPRAVEVGDDEAERALFADAQRRLLALVPDLHATLVVSGGSAHPGGTGAVLARRTARTGWTCTTARQLYWSGRRR